MYDVIIKQRKLWLTIFATIIGIAMAYGFRTSITVFHDWTLYQIGIMGLYMSGNAVSKFAEKKNE